MAEQLAFPDLVLPEATGPVSLDERFRQFHNANPHVAGQLRRLALDLVNQGHKRLGIGMLFEVLRWSAMTTRGDDGYKLNNSYRSRYARLLADTTPALADAFEFRRLH